MKVTAQQYEEDVEEELNEEAKDLERTQQDAKNVHSDTSNKNEIDNT